MSSPSQLPREPPALPRVALTRAEAAEAIGVSLDFLEEHVLPELRVVRRGRKILVPLRELERWVDEAAAFTLPRSP